MNELFSHKEGFEQAVERTKQHYYALHADIRHELLEVMTSCDNIQSLIYLHESAQPSAEAAPANRKPPSRDMKETYRRICNLCHPDKSGKEDSTLTRLMQEAKEALRSRQGVLLEQLYEQVKFYLQNPNVYQTMHEEGKYELGMRNDPWFRVHEHHMHGDTESAYYLSRSILGEVLSSRRVELDTLRARAKNSGILQ